MSQPSILDRVAAKGYTIFTNGAYNVNIVMVRSKHRVANAFDDHLHIAYKNDQGTWIDEVFLVTTDPGTYWLNNPERVEGTAILVPGQYRGTHGVGLHRGQYEALTQQFGEVAVYRDNDRDNELDMDESKIQRGFFGINIHKAGAASTKVEKWSAGCTVFARAVDFSAFMRIVKKSAQLYGNKFTITLLAD